MKRLTRAVITFAMILTCAATASAQSARVTGQVLDKDGKPWVGVTVTIKGDNGRSFTLKTDKDGKYTQIGLTPGLWTFVLTEATAQLDYTEQHQVSAGEDNNYTTNFKALMESQKVGPSAEQQKAQEDQKA